jgi:ribokinase
MHNKPKVCVVGSLVFDLVAKTNRLPKKGESILGNFFGMFPGGKGANQALAASLLGADVFMIGKVGDDFFGDKILKNMKKGKVNVSFVKISKKTKTAVALILVDKKGTNQIVMVPNANMELRKKNLKKAVNKIKSANVLLLQLEVPLNVTIESAKIAKKYKTPVILNPAPAREIPKETFSLYDFLTPNETELEILSSIKVRNLKDVKRGCIKLSRYGAKTIIVTLGEKGCFLFSKEKIKHYPAYKVKSVDTTAAGDAFNGALAVSLAQGKNIEDAINFAQKCGAISTTKMGAQTSLPKKQELNKFF